MINKRIFLSPPHMSGTEMDLIRDVFDSNYIAPLGPMVDRFEKEFSEYTGIENCLAVNCGTAATHLALHCLGVGRGDIVLASNLTFIASVSPVTFFGAAPVFIDSEESSWNMCPELLKKAIDECAAVGKLPKAVIPTDLYGQCANYDEIMAVCAPRGIPVIVDSAEAVGAKYKDRHAGKGADAAVFSFNGNKIITSSGGGMLASDNADFIQHARKLSMQAREPFPHYVHEEIGYNYRMSNVVAAIGCGQLQVIDDRVARKREIFDIYRENLEGIEGVEFMSEPAYSTGNRWLSVMLIDKEITGKEPEDLRLCLEEHNIESRSVWTPMHMQPVFKNCSFFANGISEKLFGEGLCLPSGTAMSDSELEYIISLLKNSLRS